MSKSKFISILLIEDEHSFARAVESALLHKANFKFSFHRAVTLSEGIDLLSGSGFDIVLLDLSLPDSRDLSALRKLRKHCPLLPVIILTGHEDEHFAISSLQDGAQDYLLKGELDGRILGRSILYSIERAHMIQQRDEFMAALVHDLKNPLLGSDQVYKLILEKRFGELDPRLQEITTCLKRSNESALQLLANLLEIYRYDVASPLFRPSSMDLGAVLATAFEELCPLAEIKDVDMIVEIEDNLLICADAKALKRVFFNLIGNSIKFTPKGGSIELKSKSSETQAQVSVKDSGSGISLEEQRFLFQRFYQSSSGRRYNKGLGTGLGLYVCRQIIEAHNGQIKCESIPDEGTTFIVELPKYFESAN